MRPPWVSPFIYEAEEKLGVYPRGAHKRSSRLSTCSLFSQVLAHPQELQVCQAIVNLTVEVIGRTQDGAGHFSHKKGKKILAGVILTFMEISRLLGAGRKNPSIFWFWGSSSSHLRDNQFQYFRQPQRILYEGTSPIAFHSITYFLCLTSMYYAHIFH